MHCLAGGLALLSLTAAAAEQAPIQVAQLQLSSNLTLPAQLALDDASSGTAEPTRPIATPLPYNIVMNGRDVGVSVLLQLADGRLVARESDFRRWRLRVPGDVPFMLDGDGYYALNGLPGYSAKLNSSNQTAELDFSPLAFTLTRRSTGARELTIAQKPQGLGSFLNYDVVGTRQQGSSGASQNLVSGQVELGMFNKYGALTSSWVGNNLTEEDGVGERRTVRLDTTFTRDNPADLTTLQLGDTIGGVSLLGRPVRYGGVRYARNFATQPGFITLPQPTLAGEAALPSVLEIFVDGVRRESLKLPPGPFQVDTVPTTNGLGEVQVVVRDLLGREQVLTQSFFSGAQQLGQGISDFSYEAGFVRQSFGRDDFDYGDFVAMGAHRYGFSNNFTGEARVELREKDLQNVGVGGILSVLPVGLLTAAGSYSNSDAGTGSQGLIGINRSVLRSLSFGAQLAGATRDYRTAASPNLPAPARQLSANMRYSIPSFGGVGLGYFNVLTRFPARTTEFVTLNYNTHYKRVSLNLIASQRIEPSEDLSLNLRATMPLGGNRQYFSAGHRYQDNEDGRQIHQTFARLQSSLPRDLGFGYSAEVRQNSGDTTREGLEAEANLGANGRYGSYGLAVNHRSGNTAYRASTSGSLGAFAGHVFASRRISNSFALIETGVSNMNLDIYGQSASRTDSKGVAVLPQLQPYYKNRVQIDPTNLPMSVEIPYNSIDATPYFRSGVLLALPARITRTAVLTLLQANGKPVPAGATVLVGSTAFPVGKKGLTYVSGIDTGENKLKVFWADSACMVRFDLPENAGFQPETGPLQCLEANP